MLKILWTERNILKKQGKGYWCRRNTGVKRLVLNFD